MTEIREHGNAIGRASPAPHAGDATYIRSGGTAHHKSAFRSLLINRSQNPYRSAPWRARQQRLCPRPCPGRSNPKSTSRRARRQGHAAAASGWVSTVYYRARCRYHKNSAFGVFPDPTSKYVQNPVILQSYCY
jgi:hypothetical protein